MSIAAKNIYFVFYKYLKNKRTLHGCLEIWHFFSCWKIFDLFASLIFLIFFFMTWREIVSPLSYVVSN